jgi:hypothetical protein
MNEIDVMCKRVVGGEWVQSDVVLWGVGAVGRERAKKWVFFCMNEIYVVCKGTGSVGGGRRVKWGGLVRKSERVNSQLMFFYMSTIDVVCKGVGMRM